MNLDPAKRMRQHPDDPNVWEYDVSYIRALVPKTPCIGCPYGGRERCDAPDDDTSRKCDVNTVWYGQHIDIANKLEKK